MPREILLKPNYVNYHPKRGGLMVIICYNFEG